MVKGEVCTEATLFNGLAANKMLDTINTEGYSILYRKRVTSEITASNMAVTDNTGGTSAVR
jgi:hypothetical protein